MMSRLVILLFLVIDTNGYVVNNIKYDSSTKPPLDYNEEYKKLSEALDWSNVYNKSHSASIYLDDVIFGFKNQYWSEDDMLCLNDTLHLIRSLQNYTLWAVWEWDSIASQPLGILSGNRYQLGNFDQCVTSPWQQKHPEIKTQYCLAEVVLESDNHVKKKRLFEIEPYENALDFIEHKTSHYRPLKYLTWGACVPVSCGPRAVERLVGTVLARSHLGAAGLRPQITVNETCQRSDKTKEYDGLFYAFITFTGFMFLVCLICTIINQTSYQQKYRVCNAFCLVENSKNLLKMQKDGIEVIYGIRYLTICFIAMCHQAGNMSSGPISNGIEVDDELTVFGWVLLHDDLLVDSFFVISGFLVAKAFTRYKRFPNIFIMILKRYVRLMVALAVVVFFLAAVFPYTGSGPLWERVVNEETGSCRQNGWLNILMVNNYVNTEKICLVVSWYIPCDFHFFVVAVLLFALYRRCPKVSGFFVGVIAIASLVTPGAINYINKLHAIQLFTFEFVANPRANQQFHLAYIKSHTRAAAYIIGFFAGYFFVKYEAKLKNRLSQKKSIIGVISALFIMIMITMLGVSYHFRSYSQIEGTLYAALNRPVWAAGVALFIISCAFGKVPLVKSFLSWYPWVPLSRLAYGLYLIHSIIIARSVAIARNPVYYDKFSVFLNSLSVIVISTFFAYLLWLLFEAPANNLLTLCFQKSSPHTSKDIETADRIQENNTSVESVKVSRGYMENNLPETIHISSKM